MQGKMVQMKIKLVTRVYGGKNQKACTIGPFACTFEMLRSFNFKVIEDKSHCMSEYQN